MDTLLLVLRVVVSLGVVFGALWYLQRRLAKGSGGNRERALTTVAKQGLGAKAGVAVVEAGGRRYLLGVSEHGVTVLDRLPDPEPEPELVSPTPLHVVRADTAAEPAAANRVSFAQRLAEAATTLAGRAPAAQKAAAQAGAAVPPLGVATQPDGAPAARQDAAEPSTDAPLDSDADADAAAAVPADAATVPAARSSSPLAGSILSPETWRMTAAVLRRAK